MNSRLSALATATLIISSFASVVLAQTPPNLSLVVGDPVVAEQFGGSQIILEVLRTGDPLPVVSADLKFTPGGGPPGSPAATPGPDFEAVDQRIELASGETSRLVVVKILDDGEVEGSEYFTAGLANPSPGTELQELDASPNQGSTLTLTIRDNELSSRFDVTGNIPSPAFQVTARFTQSVVLSVVLPAESFDVEVNDRIKFVRLPEGSVLAAGFFSHIDGTPRNCFARFDAAGRLDATFLPPAQIEFDRDVYPLSWPFPGWKLVPRFMVLKSGAVLVIATDGRLIRLLEAGTEDSSFRPPFSTGFLRVAEASDGSLWAVRRGTLLHLQADGVRVSSREIADLDTNQPPLAVLPDGRVLLNRDFDFLKRLLPDGTVDQTFTPIRGWRTFAVLTDGRIVQLEDWLQVYDRDGVAVPSSPPIAIGWECAGGSPFVEERGDKLVISNTGCLVSVDGIAFPSGQVWSYHLGEAPQTALRMAAQDPTNGLPAFNSRDWRSGEQRESFSVLFRRLGRTTNPALIRYATRDITAKASVDYTPQNGELHFAPFETEKWIAIPILATPSTRGGGDLEVVVSSAEGFEALPSPMRLHISGSAIRLNFWTTGGELVALFLGSNPEDPNPNPNRLVDVESSTDLQTWAFVATQKVDTAIPISANEGMRFYRAIKR